MAKMPKKDSGFSVEAINEWLMNNLIGKESLDLVNQAKNVEAKRGLQGNMVQQFGSVGMGPEAQKLLQQAGLVGKAGMYSNVADLFGVKDAYKFLESGNPSNAAWAALSVLPVGAKGLGKATKNAAVKGGAKAFNETVAMLRLLFGD